MVALYGERNELPSGNVLALTDFKSRCCGLEYHRIRWLGVSRLGLQLLTMKVPDLFVYDIISKTFLPGWSLDEHLLPSLPDLN